VPPPLRAAAGDMPLAWVYLSNWSENVPGPIGHCWSLAVEEQFYLLWPLVVAMSRPRRLLQICGSLAVAALGFRIGVRAFGLSHEIAYENTLARMDALALGAAASVLVRDPTAVARLMPRLRRALWPALVVLAACWGFGSARTGAVTQLVTYSLLAIVFAVLITLGVTEQARGGGRLSTFLSARPFRVFGKYSYAIYVVHLPLHTYVSHVLLADWFAYRGAGRYVAVQIGYAVVMTGLLLGLAMLSYHLFEKHFLRLKRFFSTAA
jgi:peptidoglycan/LPS O-acetylase OafA/YrhL